MQELITSFKDLATLTKETWWLTAILIIGALSFLFYRLVDFLQAQYVKKQPKPEDLQLSEAVYQQKRGRKQQRSWSALIKAAASWLVQVGFVAAMPYLIIFIHKQGVSYGVTYIILMIASFLLNLLISKLFPLWTPARPFVCRAYQHESVWRPGNMAFQAWGVVSWAVPVYFLWELFEVKGWIGSVIFIIISQLLQLFLFIYSIKKQAITYRQYDGLSDQFKQNLHKYLQEQGIKDEEVGVLTTIKMGPNAFATSIGGYRQIVLTEELIQGYQDPSNPEFTMKLSEDTIEAITAHEVGHVKHRHVEKSVALGIFVSSVVTVAVYHLFSGDPQSYLLFAPETSQQLMLYWGQSLFNAMFVYPLTFIMLYIGRGNESQADTFLLNTNGCKNGQDFFHQIRHIAPVPNLPLWHNCNATHPPAEAREKRMIDWSKEHCKQLK